MQLVDAEIYLTPAEVRRGLSDVQKKYECNNTQLAGLLGAPNAGAVSRFMVSGGEFGGKDQGKPPLPPPPHPTSPPSAAW
eukprot:COSAG01_NODE_24242_length_785_cov_2.968326_2_plen_80_part_00